MSALGCDIVSISRIARAVSRHGDRFLERCFSPGERAYAESNGDGRDGALAARWAAKEAFVKALGPDASGVPYHDVEVVGGGDVGPELRLHGLAARAFSGTGATAAHLSLARSVTEAIAVVLLEP